MKGHAEGTKTQAGSVLTGRLAGKSGCDLGKEVCGDEGTRTPNPCLAKAVLCQLSYAPVGWSAARGDRVDGLGPEVLLGAGLLGLLVSEVSTDAGQQDQQNLLQHRDSLDRLSIWGWA
jgi:hypothetical protein